MERIIAMLLAHLWAGRLKTNLQAETKYYFYCDDEPTLKDDEAIKVVIRKVPVSEIENILSVREEYGLSNTGK